MEKKAQNSEDEDPWVQYDLLKQRLKRLRVRFYNGRGADKERTARLRPIWYERQKEVLEDLIYVRRGLRDLQGSSNEFHFCVSAEERRWLEDQERLEALLKKSKASKRLAKLDVVKAELAVTQKEKEKLIFMRNGRPLPFRDEIFAEITEINRVYKELLIAMEESTNESIDLERRHEEAREWQRPEQYVKQERVFAQVIAQREKARESLTLEEQGVISAVRFGEADTLRKILATGRYSVQVTTGMSKETPLHFAAIGGYTDVASVLIDAGATVDAFNIDGWTPLHYCCGLLSTKVTIGLNRLEMVRLLLQRGANANLGIDNGRAVEMPDNSTPLHFASYSGANDIVQLLLKYKAEVNSPDMNGRIPIMIAAGQNHSETVEILEKAGSRMEARDYWCETAHEHVANMWLRLGRPAEEERDLQTEELLRVLGKPLTAKEVDSNLATHFTIVHDEKTKEEIERVYYRVEYKHLPDLYHAQSERLKHKRRRLGIQEILGPERTVLVVDWKLPFPLHTPKTPSAPMQSPLQLLQKILRDGLPEAAIDSYIFSNGRKKYRSYYINTTISLKNQFMLHLYIRDRLSTYLPHHGLIKSFNIKFKSLPLYQMYEENGTDVFNYYGHFDEYGLNMNDEKPSAMKLLRVTSVRQDEIPVEACPTLSRAVSVYYRKWRTEQKVRMKGAVEAVIGGNMIYKLISKRR